MSPRLLPWIVAVLLSVTLGVFAWTGYPPPSSDAPAFLVSAINVSRGKGFVNPLYWQARVADPSPRMRHVFNGPIFPLAVAVLMPWPTPQGAFLAIAALRAVSLLLSALLFERLVVAFGGGWRWPEAALVSASLCGLATHWMPSEGRPEALGTLLVLMTGLALLHGRCGALGLGALAGALAATQPLGGAELMLVIGLALAVRHGTRRWALLWGATAVVALAVFASLLAASPHGLSDSLEGMARAFPLTPWLVPPGPDTWKAWMTARRSTFYGPLLLLSVFCAGQLLMRRRRPLGSPPGFVLCLALLLGCFYLGSLTLHSLRNYNILLLAPFFFGAVLAWRCCSARQPASRRRRAAHAAALLVVLATGVGFFGRLAALPLFLRDCRTLAQARQAFERLALPQQMPVAIVGNLWMLSEDYERMRMASHERETWLVLRGVAVLLAQRDEHAGVAPELPGLYKVADFFNPGRASAGGLLAPFLKEDYAFAAYVPR